MLIFKVCDQCRHSAECDAMIVQYTMDGRLRCPHCGDFSADFKIELADYCPLAWAIMERRYGGKGG